MRKLLILAALALVTGLMALNGGQATAGGPWYVSTTGSDANDCLSPATACLTIQAAIGKASSGDTVNVAAGTYNENVTVDKPLTLQGADRETTIIDGGGSGDVVYISADYVTISGLTATNGDIGVRFIGNYTIDHVTLRDVIVTSNATQGIHAQHSNPSAYHVIEDCVISNNGGYALYAHQFGYSTIRNCEVFGNLGGRALDPAWGSYTLITGNKVHHNAGAGIHLDSMSNTTVEDNEVYSNGGNGISAGHTGTNNTIRDNVVRNNNRGIYFASTVCGNKIYHNDLIENTQQAGDPSGCNTWDDGYPSGGNYWSDYTGPDNFSGPAQTVPGSDGIGDTPYVFASDQDRYPLMQPLHMTLDHFLSYKVKRAKGTPKFEPVQVSLADQFETGLFEVKKPVSLLNPVDKNGEGISDPTAHLTCYKIKDVGEHSEFQPRDVLVSNQFGEQTLTIEEAKTLCVPSEKDEVSSALNLDHYKCYEVEEETPEFEERDVSLTDQFGEMSATVEEPEMVCNPVDKDGEGIIDPTAHLTCYEVEDIEGHPKFEPLDVLVSNQFGEQNLTVKKAKTLCVPSEVADLGPSDIEDHDDDDD